MVATISRANAPTVVALPSSHSTTVGIKRNRKQTSKGLLVLLGVLLSVCLFTIWLVNLQLILDARIRRSLEAESESSQVLGGREEERIPQINAMFRGANSLPPTSNDTSTTTSTSHFHLAASIAYSHTEEQQEENHHPVKERTKFDLSTWTRTIPAGDYEDEDLKMLGRIYSQANSVFEFGLGESTYIANHVGVERFSGVHSDATWISMIRDEVNENYRFYFADVGMTDGYRQSTPNIQPKKSAYNYQVVPLLGEPKSFDVYILDGPFRVGCLLLSFLHASSSAVAASHEKKEEETSNTTATTSSPHAAVSSPTTVLVHDCWRQEYHVADHLLDLIEHTNKTGAGGDQTEHPHHQHNSVMSLCAYQRKIDTTDEQILELWSSLFQNIA